MKIASNGIGYGTDQESQSSVTKAGITGIAGHKEITTENKDAFSGVVSNVLADDKVSEVNKELGAQTAITQEFGKVAPKAVGDYASNKTKKYENAQLAKKVLLEDIANASNETEKQQLTENLQAVENVIAQEQNNYDNWKEGGTYRVALHTAIGALGTGSVEGALTTGAVAKSAPTLNQIQDKMQEVLVSQGMNESSAESVAKGVTMATLLGIGESAGLDSASTVTAVNVDANNRLLHYSEMKKLNESAEKLANKYGKDEEYWKKYLYVVAYSKLDKRENQKYKRILSALEKNAYSQLAQNFKEETKLSLEIANAEYQKLKQAYGNVLLKGTKRNPAVYMFDASGHYDDSGVFGTYSGAQQVNWKNTKKTGKIASNITKTINYYNSVIDAITPVYPEDWVGLGIGAGKLAITGGKAVLKNRASVRTADDIINKARIENNIHRDDIGMYNQYMIQGNNWDWPPNLGFQGQKINDTLPIGYKVDRIGSPKGAFMSPKGTPSENRALAPGSMSQPTHEYVVIKPLPVTKGKIAPAFGQPGGGTQILPNFTDRVNIQWLLDNGYLKEIK